MNARDLNQSPDSAEENEYSSDSEVMESEDPSYDLPATLLELQERFANDPYDFETGVALIHALRSQGNNSTLRKVREEMHERFALLPEMWNAWIEDELRTAFTVKERRHVFELFELALKDYTDHGVLTSYIDLILEQWQLSIELPDKEKTFSSIHDVSTLLAQLVNRYEHFPQICHIPFYALIRVESEHLQYSEIASSKGSPRKSSKSKPAQKKESVQDLFLRLLKTPHTQHAQTFDMYREWIQENKPDLPYDEHVWWVKIEGGYDQAVATLNRLDEYERECSTNSSLAPWKSYLWFLNQEDQLKQFIPSVIERCLSAHFLNALAWHFIVMYATEPLDYLTRAVRNVTWYSQIWPQYLEFLELSLTKNNELNADGEELLATEFSRALLATQKYISQASDIEGMVALYVWKLQKALRPLLNSLDPHKNSEEAEKAIKEVYVTSIEAITKVFPSRDPYARIETIYAQAMLRIAENGETSVATMKNVISNEYQRNYSENWITFFRILMSVNRSDFQKDVMDFLLDDKLFKTMDYPERIFQYLHQETSFMRIADITLLRRLFTKRINQVQMRRLYDSQTHQKNELNNPRPKKSGPDAVKKRNRDDDSAEPKKRAKHEVSKATEPPKIGEEEKNNKPTQNVYHKTDPSKVHFTIFVSNLPQKITEDTVKQTFSGCGEINDVRITRKLGKNDKENTFAYIEFETEESVQLALLKDRTPIDVPGTTKTRPMFVSKFKPKLTNAADEPPSKIVYVGGLPESIVKEELHDIFGKYGYIIDLRIVQHKKDSPAGVSKTFAFVEFDTPENAFLATAEDKKVLLHNGKDFTIHVNISYKSAHKTITTNTTLGAGSVTTKATGRTPILAFKPRSLLKQKK